MTELRQILTDFVLSHNNNARAIFGILANKKGTDLLLSIYEHTSNLPEHVKLAQRTYHIINSIVEIPTCKICNNKVRFKDFRNGYCTYCSLKCSSNDQDTKDKIEQTCLTRYGVTHSSRIQGIQEKKKQTWLAKYGVDNPFKNKEIQQKYKETMLANHGVASPAKSETIRAKQKVTIQALYGVDNIAKSEKIKQKIAKTLYANNNGPCSKQQKYIHALIGGELNYPVGSCRLDIAFPEDKIYFEYDGGGHDLSVKLGSVTQEAFKTAAFRRRMFLYKKGWKKICLISRKDFLPIDSILTLLTANANYILRKRSWITFDIDKSTIQTSKYSAHFDFGELQRVK